MLSFVEYGETSSPGLLIAHGLFGSARNWGAIAKDLGSTYHVVAVDMRNHGQSIHSDEMSYPAMADDLAEVISSQGGKMFVLGHSMGGKAAMALALRAPDLVERLIVGDIAPVAYGHSHIGLIDAMEQVDLGTITRRKEADVALAAHVSDRSLRGFLLQSLEVEDGTARWKFNLSALRHSMADLIGFPQIDGTFGGPALFLAGDRSDYVDDASRDAITEKFSRARIVKLKDAGHWLHADQPEAFTATVRAYLGG